MGQKNFPGKSGSVMHNSIWVSSTMPKLEKVNDTITENAQRDRWKDGWKDGQTLFYRTLPATVEGPKINWMPGADLSHLPNNQGEKLEKLLEEEYKVFLKDENDIG